MVLTYVSDDKTTAWNEAAKPVNHMLQLYKDWAEEAGDNNNDDQSSRDIPSPEEMMQEQTCDFFGEPAFIGTADFVYEGLSQLLERSPCTHLVMMGSLPGAPREGTKRNLELLARDVIPRLKEN